MSVVEQQQVRHVAAPVKVMPEESKTVAILRGGKALVEQKWIKGRYTDGQDGFCMLGAVEFSARTLLGHPGHVGFVGEPIRCLHQAIGSMWPPLWNDDPRREKSEVLAAFDRAIEIAESKQ